jgi:hypothetical protein
VSRTRVDRRLAPPNSFPTAFDQFVQTETSALITRTSSRTDTMTLSAEIAQLNAPQTRQMVAGTAIGRYPSNPATNAEDYFDYHESLFGAIPCYRSYTSGGIPTTWSNAPGVNHGAGHTTRWSWPSFKPAYGAYVQSTTPSANDGYDDIRAFIDTIPENGMIKILTVHHETDVGNKIPDVIPTQAEAKLLWYVAGKAVQDSGHPEVMYAIVAGSKDTINRGGGLGMDPIMAATWAGASVSQSTGLLNSVTDIMAWDPYNIASQDGNYAANRQDPPFFFDPIVEWNQDNFPNARFAVAETGYRPNQANLTMRPTWLTAMKNYLIDPGVECMAMLYFDTVVALGKQNWLGEYVNPRHDGTTNAYTFPGGTTFPADTGTIAVYEDFYVDYAAYATTAAALSDIR